MDLRCRLVTLALTLGACRWGFDDQATSDAGGDGGQAATELCTLHWCWERAPSPEHRSLRAISGSSTSDVWAAGDGGVIRHWDGNAWSVVASPTNDAIVAIDVASPSDVTLAAGAGSIWHYDGASWTETKTPSGSSVAALWRAPDGKLWAAGDLGTLAIDGATAPSIPPLTASTALHGTSTSDVWQAGFFNSVAHWTGASWASVLISDFPVAVHANANGTALVGGGSLWTCNATLTCTQSVAAANVAAMWASSDTDVWAVGYAGAISHFTTLWAPSQSPTTANLTAVWGASADDIWAVGEHGTIVHYTSAGGWTTIAGSQPSDTGWGAIWVGDDDDRWLVGPGNTMWHSDGGDPVQFPLPANAQPGDEIAGTSTDLYALDRGSNQIMHWDGASWQHEYPVSATPVGLAATSSEVIVTTIMGEVYTKPLGGTWASSFNTPGTELHGVCISPSGVAIALGRFGDAVVRTAGSWARNDTPTGRFLLGCGFTADTAYGAGADVVVRFDSGTWTLVPAIKTGQSISGFVVASANEIYAAATGGRLVRFDGLNWAEEALPVGASFGKLARSQRGTIYLTGPTPGILRRR